MRDLHLHEHVEFLAAASRKYTGFSLCKLASTSFFSSNLRCADHGRHTRKLEEYSTQLIDQIVSLNQTIKLYWQPELRKAQTLFLRGLNCLL